MNFFNNNAIPVTDADIQLLEDAVKKKQEDGRKQQRAALLNNQLKQLNGSGFNFDREKAKKYAIGVVIGVVVILVIVKILT